jgi:hypothetical protein
MNHHYEVDWLFGYMGAEHFKVLGNARYLGVRPRSNAYP